MQNYDRFYDTLRDFANYYTDYIPEIPVVRHVPTANEFFCRYVIPNKPYLMSCPEGHLPAVERFKKPCYIELKNEVQSLKQEVTINVIPTYRPYPIYTDPISGPMYMVPEVRKMCLYSFILEHDPTNVEEFQEAWKEKAYYFVMTDNNLDEYPNIAEDIRPDVPWATEALGKGPIAANISIGHRPCSVLMHKDYYDNFFFVLRGTRIFKLIPPIAHTTIPRRRYKKYQYYKKYIEEKGEYWWRENELDEEIEVFYDDIEHPYLVKKWPDEYYMDDLERKAPDCVEKSRRELEEKLKIIDEKGYEDYENYYLEKKELHRNELERNSFFRNIKQYEVTVKPGDALYIPSLWYHEHRQSNDTIVLNYRYEMKWDLKFPLLRFLDKLFNVKEPAMHNDVSVDLPVELEKSLIEDLYDKRYLTPALRIPKTLTDF